MVDQEIKRQPSFKEFRDFLELLKLGHFGVSENHIAQAIAHYNHYQDCKKKISHLNDITPEFGQEIERRLTDRVIQIKPMKRLINDLTYANTPSQGGQQLYAAQR